MLLSGSKLDVMKGKKTGGRQKNTPNKATVAKMRDAKIVEQAAEELAKETGMPGGVAQRVIAKVIENKRLAKDELEDVVPILKSIVARHQQVAYRTEPGTPGYQDVEWERLRTWLELFIDTCVRLADFQSPKFRAQFVIPPPAVPLPFPTEDNVVHLDDPVRLANVYRRLVTGGGPRK